MKLVIVVPCYNEEAVLPETTARLSRVLDKLIQRKSIDEGMILYVDDGSSDSTWSLIERYSGDNVKVGGLKLAHNRGHQHALWAGLEWAAANADAAISIDADLQDDENVIPEMVDYFNAGIDIVFGVRKERNTDTLFKRTTAIGLLQTYERARRQHHLQPCRLPADEQAYIAGPYVVSRTQPLSKRDGCLAGISVRMRIL